MRRIRHRGGIFGGGRRAKLFRLNPVPSFRAITARVTFRVAVKKSQAGRFDEKLTDCMQGRVKISVNGEYYNAFEA
ncbi:MAG: DUF1949 domain-containing protein [Christensenellaceae bacterium]